MFELGSPVLPWKVDVAAPLEVAAPGKTKRNLALTRDVCARHRGPFCPRCPTGLEGAARSLSLGVSSGEALGVSANAPLGDANRHLRPARAKPP